MKVRVALLAVLLSFSCSSLAEEPKKGKLLWKPKSHQSEKWLAIYELDNGRVEIFAAPGKVYQFFTVQTKMTGSDGILEVSFYEIVGSLKPGQEAREPGWRALDRIFSYPLSEYDTFVNAPNSRPAYLIVQSNGNESFLIVIYRLRPRAEVIEFKENQA